MKKGRIDGMHYLAQTDMNRTVRTPWKRCLHAKKSKPGTNKAVLKKKLQDALESMCNYTK